MRQLSAAVVALACVGPARASVYAAPQVIGAVPTTTADASTASVAGAARVPAAPAAFVENSRLRIPKVSRPPQLKDFLSGTAREAETVVTEFRQRQPGDGEPISHRTVAYLSYDDANLYVVFVCDDLPGSVRAHMAKREQTGDDDVVAVYLDTFHDRRHAYVFQSNPLGLQRDGLLNAGQKSDYTFDTVWSTDGRLTESGYVVWMAIPFKSLRFPNGDPQTWGIAVQRKILRTNEDAFWPYITDRVAGFVNQLGTLEPMNDVSPGRNVWIGPYGTFTGSQFLDGHAAAFRSQTENRGGIDSKFVIKDALTLDLTANPDFSQVESDEPQVTVNQRYEVKFAEKRPFFMDNAGYFQTPVNLVYSRRIVDPQLGARLTGKINGWAVGALLMNDRAEGEQLKASDPLFGGRAGIGLLRVQRDFGSQSNVCLLVTSRDFGPSSNRVVAFDTRLKLSPNWYFTGQVMGSGTEKLNGKQSSGAGFVSQLEYNSRNFSHSTSYKDFSPGFRTDLGYVKRVDLRAVSESAGYLWYRKGGVIQSYGPSVAVSADWDHQGKLQDWYTYPMFAVNLARQSSIQVARSEAYEVYGDGFRESLNYLSLSTSLTKGFAVYASYSRGTGLNYAPASGQSPFLGLSTNTSLGMTWRPAQRIRLDNSYIYTALSTRADDHPQGVSPSANIFFNHIARSKVNYQFTRALSLRTIFDYYALRPNQSLIDYTLSKSVTADVLMTYMIHPGTAFYIGYTNRMENLAIDPAVPGGLRLTGSPGTTTGRQFFAKFSYLFRL